MEVGHDRVGAGSEDLLPQQISFGPVVLGSLREGFRVALQDREPGEELVEGGVGKKGLDRLGLADRVTWPGEVPDAPAWIAGAALLVHPSRREALGTAVLEAMAVGTPVVACAAGGLVDLLGDGHGRLVSPGDAAALAAAVLDLLAAPEAAPSPQAEPGSQPPAG